MESSDSGRFLNQVWRTTDSARSWVRLGQAFAPDTILLTLDAAPSDPSRIYVTGLELLESDGGGAGGQGVLLRSENDGLTWQRTSIAGSAGGFAPYLSAVHPSDPRKIYVRLRGPGNPSENVTNRLAYSFDGGESWQQIYEARADMLGFALSPDGNRIALGLGDSREPGGDRPVDKGILGLYSASTTDHQFVLKRSGHIGCLTWAADNLYFCASEFPGAGLDPLELGLSTDEGASSKTLMRLAAVEGQLSCPAGAGTAQSCSADDWIRACEAIGRCDATGAPLPYPRSETCPDGSGATGGVPSTPDGGAAGGNASADRDELRIREDCSISLPGQRNESKVVFLLALAALGTLRRRRYA